MAEPEGKASEGIGAGQEEETILVEEETILVEKEKEGEEETVAEGEQNAPAVAAGPAEGGPQEGGKGLSRAEADQKRRAELAEARKKAQEVCYNLDPCRYVQQR